jgi:hypothetical protein
MSRPLPLSRPLLLLRGRVAGVFLRTDLLLRGRPVRILHVAGVPFCDLGLSFDL